MADPVKEDIDFFPGLGPVDERGCMSFAEPEGWPDIVNSGGHQNAALETFVRLRAAPPGLDGIVRPQHDNTARNIKRLFYLFFKTGPGNEFPIPPYRPAFPLQKPNQRCYSISVRGIIGNEYVCHGTLPPVETRTYIRQLRQIKSVHEVLGRA